MPSLNTGNAILSNPIKVDSSYNVGIGGAASGSFKLQVTGTTNLTGALTGTSAGLSSTLSAMGTNIQFNLDGTFGTNYYTMGFGGVSNGFNRISGGTGTTDGLYITSATGRDIVFRTNGSASNTLVLLSTGAATFSSSIDVATTARFHSSSNWMQFQQNVLTSQNNDGAHIRSVVSADSAPTYSWTGDQDTGMYTPAANTIAFSTGATERMRITSGGNVGIGSSDAGALLVLRSTQANSSNYPWLTFRNGANGYGTWGFFKSGSNNLSLGYSTDTDTPMNNATAITFQYGGNVGIGTSSPPSRLSVQWDRSTAFSGLGVYDSQAFNASNHGGTITFGGTFNSGGSITEWASVGGTKANTTDGDYAGNLSFYTRPNGSGMIERMTILSSGQTNFTHNTTNQDIIYATNGSASPYGMNITYTAASPNNGSNNFLYLADSTTLRFAARSNGGLSNFSGNNINLASDRRLKKDIISLSSQWDKLKQIEVVNYKYKDSTDETALYGAIAQQVQEVYPELVIVTREATETEPEYYGLREQPFQWLTTKVLQEAMARIELLEEKVKQLENK